MDPNNPASPGMPQPLNTSQTPVETPIGVPTSQAPSPVTSSSSGSKKIMIIAIIILVLAVLGIVGYYFYTMSMKSKAAATEEEVQANQEAAALQDSLDSIENTDPEEELAQIDNEISLLEATPSSN